MIQDIDSGKKDVRIIATEPVTKSPPSPAGQEIAMLLALQKKEWQELRSTSGVVLQLISLQEPTSGKKVLLVAFGSENDDIEGNSTTLDITVNGYSIDAIVEAVATNKPVAEIHTMEDTGEK